MRSYEELRKFTTIQELEEEKKRLEEFILKEEKLDGHNAKELIETAKEYLFIDACLHESSNKKTISDIYKDINFGIELDKHFSLLSEKVTFSKDFLEEVQLDWVKALAYSGGSFKQNKNEYWYNTQLKAEKWANDVAAYLEKHSYEEYKAAKKRVADNNSIAKDYENLRKKEADDAEIGKEQDKSTVKDARSTIINDAYEFERQINAVDYFMFRRGSNEFREMKKKIVALRKCADNLPNAKSMKVEDMAEYYDKLQTAIRATKKYLNKKEMDFQEDPFRKTDPDKQKREQPRIQAAIKLLEKMQDNFTKGQLAVRANTLKNITRKVKDNLLEEERIRKESKGDKDKFLSSCARTIRIIQYMDGTNWTVGGESLEDFHKNKLEGMENAIYNKGRDRILVDEMKTYEKTPELARSRMDSVYAKLCKRYEDNSLFAADDNFLSTQEIKNIMVNEGIQISGPRGKMQEAYNLSLDINKNVIEKYSGLVNKPEREVKLQNENVIQENQPEIKQMGMGI